MASGQLSPISVTFPNDGLLFSNVHETPNGTKIEGVGLAASLGTATDLQLQFHIPPEQPAGTTVKFLARPIADGTSADVDLNIRWKSFATEEDMDIAKTSFPTAEGTSTITWAAGDDHVFKEVKVTMDADTVVDAEIVHMYVQFEVPTSALAAISTWVFHIIWE